MSDLICRKSMTRCLTPGMCSPHGGCRDDAAANGTELRNLRTDNAQLVYALKQQEQNYLVLLAERDQLNDELSACKEGPGTCGYWREVARAHLKEIDQLKAEKEALRNALMECTDSPQGEMLQKFGGQLPDDMHPVTRREYDRDMAEIAGYRAAMGKGEQS